MMMCVFLYVMMFLLMSDFFTRAGESFSPKIPPLLRFFCPFDLRIHTKQTLV